ERPPGRPADTLGRRLEERPPGDDVPDPEQEHGTEDDAADGPQRDEQDATDPGRVRRAADHEQHRHRGEDRARGEPADGGQVEPEPYGGDPQNRSAPLQRAEQPVADRRQQRDEPVVVEYQAPYLVERDRLWVVPRDVGHTTRPERFVEG